MAAIGSMSAAPSHVSAGSTYNAYKRQTLNFDPYILSQKLEAAKREQDGTQVQSEKRKSTPVSVFVPKTAAKQFAATTTSTTYDLPMRSKSARVKREPVNSVSEKHQSTAEGKPVLNPKQIFAALNMGMSETEASFEPLQRVTSGENPTQHPQHKPHSKDRCSADKRRSVELPQRSASTRPYRPGDAAKRNMAAKRASMAAEPSSRLIATVRGSQTTHQRVDLPEVDPFADEEESLKHLSAGRAKRINPNAMPYDLPMPSGNPADDGPLDAHRPGLYTKERPNWTQQSQCGDEMRAHLLSVPLLHRKRENQLEQQAGSAHTKRPDTLRRHSSAPQQSRRKKGEDESHMISDAVKLLKKEERKQKRQSLIGLFKKL